MMMNSLIASEGGSSFGMIAMLVGGCFNLVLDPVLIFGCKLGVSGAAIATLISSLVSTGMYIFYLGRGNTYLKVLFKYFQPTGFIYKEIFKIGLPICFFQFLSGGAVSLTNIVAKPFGEAAIASMGIVNRIMSLETQALYGFLKGYSPLAVNILFGIICIVFARQLIYLFNQESSQVVAIGKAKQGGMLSIFRQGLFFIPFLLIFSSLFGIMGMIFAQLIADICATVITLIMWKKERILQSV